MKSCFSLVVISLAVLPILLFNCDTGEKRQNIDPEKNPFTGLEHLFTTPKNYVAYKTGTPILVDGELNEKDWDEAEWTDEFVDIEGDLKPKPYLATRVKMLWDDQYFYFAAELMEPHIWAYLTEHDDVIFLDNDFEIFIDADNDGNRPNYRYPDHDTHRYYEFEMNALNTTWDLFLDRAYRNGGLPMTNWEIKGLKTAVKLYGTLNDPGDKDTKWTLEVAIPFSSITFGRKRENTPEDGDQYRVNFSRVQYDTDIIDGRYVKQKDSTGKELPEYNWTWSPQGVINMHFPERWGYVQFSSEEVGSGTVPFTTYYATKQKDYLWLIYYRQKEWAREHSGYALTLSDLGLSQKIDIEGIINVLTLEGTSRQFIATITSEEEEITWSIDQEGKVSQSPQE